MFLAICGGAVSPRPSSLLSLRRAALRKRHSSQVTTHISTTATTSTAGEHGGLASASQTAPTAAVSSARLAPRLLKGSGAGVDERRAWWSWRPGWWRPACRPSALRPGPWWRWSAPNTLAAKAAPAGTRSTLCSRSQTANPPPGSCRQRTPRTAARRWRTAGPGCASTCRLPGSIQRRWPQQADQEHHQRTAESRWPSPGPPPGPAWLAMSMPPTAWPTPGRRAGAVQHGPAGTAPPPCGRGAGPRGAATAAGCSSRSFMGWFSVVR